MNLAKLWSRLNLSATGLRPEYHGRERIDPDRPCIYVANHQSTLDIWLMILLLPVSTRFVAKDALFRIPILGWALSSAGFIPIDRSNHNSAMRSLEKAAVKIRSGRPLVMFPEGTRSRDGNLAPFKKGAFHLALQAGVPVVPVSLQGTFEAMPPGFYRINRVPVHVRVHPAIDVEPFASGDARRLMHAVREAIASGLDR
jgi:1-acyl-sn-glycerol-3-phosphate acyltransferase